MNNITPLKNSIERILPILEASLGLLFLILKIYETYSYHIDLNNIPEGLKNLLDMELMRYGDILLWSICLVTGCTYWICKSKKTYCVLSVVVICLLILKFGISITLLYHQYPIINFYISMLFALLYIIFKIRQISALLKSIKYKIALVCATVSIIACLFYWYLEACLPFRIGI